MMRGAAAQALGLERGTALGYIQDHPVFEFRVEDAEEEALEHIEEGIFQAGASGNFPAAKLWIERHDERKKARLARRAAGQVALEIAEDTPEIPGERQPARDELDAELDELLG